ncbi:OHCU decarboxylase [Chromobacterium sp. LK11]|uniref:2-oxo-4-hydroxy-4-carboxy-5-ureidoimidazoline decarboxylase n=1 Tax=Chromobacterium sp. LK11 TaxID=1628212 RepID=UPI000653C305|nr:2-oxo-4-hydroxy-4-carboxy-5-ureidoimidazoline decarboxylase [Chromobacterium sp. LK11]KMN82497.1 OHCU decarboxylase [Chromobacterium sp. LK11]
MSLTLAQLNTLPTERFTAALGGIFEHSPWVAAQAAGLRPFASVADLHGCMRRQVEEAGVEAQLRLIRAHPELAGKAALHGEVTAESAAEQGGAGLDRCSPQELELLRRLNADYRARFGFPFILAVRGYQRADIIAEFQRRLAAEPAAERQACLQQIYRIAGLRLAELIA